MVVRNCMKLATTYTDVSGLIESIFRHPILQYLVTDEIKHTRLKNNEIVIEQKPENVGTFSN